MYIFCKGYKVNTLTELQCGTDHFPTNFSVKLALQISYTFGNPLHMTITNKSLMSLLQNKMPVPLKAGYVKTETL